MIHGRLAGHHFNNLSNRIQLVQDRLALGLEELRFFCFCRSAGAVEFLNLIAHGRGRAKRTRGHLVYLGLKGIQLRPLHLLRHLLLVRRELGGAQGVVGDGAEGVRLS